MPDTLVQSTHPDADPTRPIASQVSRPASPPDTPGSVSTLTLEKQRHNSATFFTTGLITPELSGSDTESSAAAAAEPAFASIVNKALMDKQQSEDGTSAPAAAAAVVGGLGASGNHSFESVGSSSTSTSEGPTTPAISPSSSIANVKDQAAATTGLGVIDYGKQLNGGSSVEYATAGAATQESKSPVRPTQPLPASSSGDALAPATIATPRRSSDKFINTSESVGLSSSRFGSHKLLARSPEKAEFHIPNFPSSTLSDMPSAIQTNGLPSSTSPYTPASYGADKLSPSHPGLSNDPYGEKSAFRATSGSHPLTSVPTSAAKKVPFTDSTGYWLALYFAFNLGLTLFNKLVLVKFPFPYTLTGLHALSGSAGCYIALERGVFVPARLTSKENLVLAAFSVLYTINIAISSVSLQMVTLPFHQVVRASTPLFTILIAAVFFRGRFSVMKLVSLLPVVAGVGFATYGDIYFTAWGLILTLLGTFLAALKTVVTNVIQSGGGGRLKLHPLDLLMRMSPLAFIQCVVYGYMTGELERVREYGAKEMTRGKALALLVNGIIAFGLNIVSFTANKKAGALTMTVSANCKQVMTIVFGIMLFNVQIGATNALGIILTLVGGGWYAYIEYAEKSNKRLGRIVEKP